MKSVASKFRPCCLFVFFLVSGSLCQARDWTDSRTKQVINSQTEGCEPGFVVLTTPMKETVRLPLNALTEADRTYANKKFGIGLIDMTGVWRSDSGTYYAMAEGREGRVYVTMLESPTLSSIEGTLNRKQTKIISEQWLIVFKNDPTRKVRTGKAQYILTPDGRIRANYDYVYINARGFEIGRKQVSSAYVKVDYPEIPERLIARYFPRAKSESERRQGFISRLVLAWVADTASKSFDPKDGLFQAVARVGLSRVSDSFIRTGLKELFPSLSEDDIELLQKVVRIYLDKPSAERIAEDEIKGAIVDLIDTEAPNLSGNARVAEFLYDVYRERRGAS